MGGHLTNLGFLSLLLILEFGHINLALGCSPFDISSSTKGNILNYHNAVRQRVANGEQRGRSGLLPPATNMKEMKWNNDLARKAQGLANQCVLGHDDDRTRRINSRNYDVGQNIAYLYRHSQKQRWDDAFDGWYEEVKYFPNQYVDRFVFWSPIGHYSQIIWADTYEIGCGASRRPCSYEGNSYPSCEVYVCNYGPTGNYNARPVYNQGSPASFLCDYGGSTKYQGLCKA